jgi:hypothetical protein
VRTLLTAVTDAFGRLWELIRPRPEGIRLMTVRGETAGILPLPVQAGQTRSWRDTIVADGDGVLLVVGSLTAEHGLDLLGDEPDTNVELALLVDGARVGRALETVRRGDDRALACSASIAARPGLREVRMTFRPADAGVRIAEISLAALFVPESQASIVVRR